MCIVYNTPMNTVGIGDPVPFGGNSYGSGDRFDTPIKNGKKTKIAVKKPAYNGTMQLPYLVMSKNKK